MPTEDIKFKFSADGSQQVISALKSVREGSSSVATATREGARVASESAKASQAQSFQINQLGSTLGLVGNALGRFNPQVGQMATAAGAATGVIQTLSSSALGPVGIAIGVVTAAAGVLAPAFAHMGEAAEEAARQIRENLNRSLQDYVSDAQAAQRATETMLRVRQGLGTSIEQQAESNRLANRTAALRAGLESAVSSSGIPTLRADQVSEETLNRLQRLYGHERGAEIENIRQSLRLYNQEQDRYTESVRLASVAGQREIAVMAEHTRKAKEEAAAMAARSAARHGGRHGATATEDNDAANLRAKAIREEIAAQERQLELERELDREREKALEFARAQAEEAAALIASEKELLAAKMAAAEAALAIEKTNRSDEKANETRDAIKALLGDAQVQFTEFANAAGSAIVTAFQSDGGAKAFVAALSEQAKGLAKLELGKGIAAGAEALGLAIFDPPGAALKAAEAGEHFAAAAVFGGIGAAAGGGRGTSSGTTSRPEPSSNSGGGGEQKTVVINYGGDVITAATHAELGRTIRGLVEIGDARLGRG